MAFGRKFTGSKYGSKKVARHGYSFASKLEAAVYDYLHALELAGEISDLKVQQRVYFFKNPDIYMIPDFSFLNSDGVLEYAEAKGMQTDTYKIKRKLWVHMISHRLTVYGGSYSKIRVIEIIN